MKANTQETRRSIEQVNRMLRSIVEAETLEHFFWVSGRIRGFHQSDLGHMYFVLAEDNSSIRCMIREENANQISFALQNHLEVEVYGDLHFYEDRAVAQINVLKVVQLNQAIDTTPTIDRLRAEKLYPVAKKPPPKVIRQVGIVTNKSSRAVGDFENAYRKAGERVALAPVSWQWTSLEGPRAARSITDAIVELDSNPEIDVIAIIRGGGRNQNLATFDDIEILRAIAKADTFTISGIGHHKDSTLTDKIVDYVAATPTAVGTYLATLCLQSASGREHQPTRAQRQARRQNIIIIALTIVAVGLLLLLLLVMLGRF